MLFVDIFSLVIFVSLASALASTALAILLAALTALTIYPFQRFAVSIVKQQTTDSSTVDAEKPVFNYIFFCIDMPADVDNEIGSVMKKTRKAS